MIYDQTASDGASGNRRLLAMLFVDLVRSTDLAVSMGDAGWVSVLGGFRTQAEATIAGYGGRLVNWIGDGFLATFAVPAGAVGCGIRLVDVAREMDLEVRGGVHTSEVVLEGDDIAGIAVHIAARIMALASPSEVLVSRTTVEVTAGTEFAYNSRGVHRLRGIKGDWDLFAATDSKQERLTDVEPRDQIESFFEAQTLVERDRELTVFNERLDRMIEQERGSVMVIAAESGMGKTALVRTFAALNASRASFYFGQSDDLIAARTLGPVRDILHAAGLALPTAPSPDQVHEQLDKLVSRSHPAVVVMEDLHWADDGTLDAVRHLYHRLDTRRSRIMLVMTFRPEDVREGHPLRRLLASLRGRLVDRVELAALTVEGIVILSGRSLIDARDLERLTGGNPLFVTEVIDSGGELVPASVRDAVMGRFDRLSAGTQKLVRFMSVVPTKVERWLLEGIVDAPADSLIEAEREGLIVGDGNFAWFRHELVRRAIEESLPSMERLEWNKVVLRELLERESDMSRIVHHAAMAEDADALIHWAPKAADAAIAAGSYRQAVDHLRLVLRHADRLDKSRRAELLGELSHTLYLINRFEEANRYARSAVEILETQDDTTALAASLINLSRTAFWATGPLEARTAGQRALEVADADDVETRALAHAMLARAHSNLATLGVVAEPSALALEHAQAALDLAERLDRDDLRSHALNYRGTARLALGNVEGATDLERSVILASKQPRIEYVMPRLRQCLGRCLPSRAFRRSHQICRRGSESK